MLIDHYLYQKIKLLHYLMPILIKGDALIFQMNGKEYNLARSKAEDYPRYIKQISTTITQIFYFLIQEPF